MFYSEEQYDEFQRDLHAPAPSIAEDVHNWVYGSAHPDAELCPCHGGGWMLSDYDTWESCPCHKSGPHPESQMEEALEEFYADEDEEDENMWHEEAEAEARYNRNQGA